MKRLLVALVAVGVIIIFEPAGAPMPKPQTPTWEDPQQAMQSADAALMARWNTLLTIAAFPISAAIGNAAKLEAMKVGAQLMDRGYCAPQRGPQWEKCQRS